MGTSKIFSSYTDIGTALGTRDLRSTPKPDFNSDSVGVGVSKTKFFGVGVGFSEKIFRSQIEIKVMTTFE